MKTILATEKVDIPEQGLSFYVLSCLCCVIGCFIFASLIVTYWLIVCNFIIPFVSMAWHYFSFPSCFNLGKLTLPINTVVKIMWWQFPICWWSFFKMMWNQSQFHSVLVRSFIYPAVEVFTHGRSITVKGPRGVLKRNFNHLNLELTRLSKKKIRVDVWFAKKKELACLRTICSHIQNLMKGVIYVSMMNKPNWCLQLKYRFI